MSKIQFSKLCQAIGTEATILIAEFKGISQTQINLWLTSLWKPAYWVR